jgi:hypothetical protein
MIKERLLWFSIGAGIIALMHGYAKAGTTNEIGKVVLINDAGATRPAQSIATPAQVTSAEDAASAAAAQAVAVSSIASNAQVTAQAAYDRTCLYSTNFIVTSTVYVQSIGGVPYDPSNQTIVCRSVAVVGTNVQIVATVAQDPLVTPTLDWRQKLNTGVWTNIAATVAETSIPAGVTNAAKAYLFTLPKPSLTNAFFRVVDNSTGASGSGLYWLVFGSIFVDGQEGWTGSLTNVIGAVTNTYQIRGGIVVNPSPL